jgi:polar amino acid transport system substrate-binding protein
MVRFFRHLILATTVLLLLSLSLPAADLMILTENLAPLNFVKEGVLVGPAVDMVKEIQRRVGSHAQIQVYPWARAYKMALEEENIILFGMAYTQVRRDRFYWIGPIARKSDIFVARKGSGIHINSLEDAKRVERIGTLRDDTKEIYLKSRGFTNLVPTHDDQRNAKKLALGRIDLWVTKKPGVKTICDLAEVDYRKLEEIYTIRQLDISIAVSRKTSVAIVQRWKAAFDEMLADGTVLKIQKKWNRLLEDDPFPEINVNSKTNY